MPSAVTQIGNRQSHAECRSSDERRQQSFIAWIRNSRPLNPRAATSARSDEHYTILRVARTCLRDATIAVISNSERSLRLAAQDVALSRRKQGFESPRERQSDFRHARPCAGHPRLMGSADQRRGWGGGAPARRGGGAAPPRAF